MPNIALKLFELRDDPAADVQSLAAIIGLDPGLTSKLIHYAATPFFGYGGRIESIEDAITRVLGFDKALHMALALDTGQSFDVPLDGPIGLKAIWRQSLYCATLTQLLAEKLPPEQRPGSGMMYMAGLLHNIGFLLLGHQFKMDFNALNKKAEEHPDISILDLEERVLGISHTDIGVWLMREWCMPTELVISTYEHHNPSYKGQHHVYPNLILIANRLLRQQEIGDETETSVPKAMLDKLGLSQKACLAAYEQLFENHAALETMVQELHT